MVEHAAPLFTDQRHELTLVQLLRYVAHPDPRRVPVIGLGGGATAGAVAQHATTGVDIVELSASVRRGAAFFAHANYHVLEQPDVQVRVDDGRTYLLTTDRRYELTADIIQPEHAGAGLLYSVEYCKRARSVLTDYGVMLQWGCGRCAATGRRSSTTGRCPSSTA